MEQFFDYITSQLIKKLKERTVVVWYDESRHFVPYMEALLRGTPEGLDVKNVRIGDMDVCVTLFEGSFFKVRACPGLKEIKTILYFWSLKKLAQSMTLS